MQSVAPLMSSSPPASSGDKGTGNRSYTDNGLEHTPACDTCKERFKWNKMLNFAHVLRHRDKV